MKIKINVTEDLGQKVGKRLEDMRRKVIHAIDESTDKLSDSMLEQGREDIESSGNFGSRWTQGLTAETESDDELSRTITIREAVEYWKVFQTGAEIHGKPLLWIPFSDSDAEGISAKDYPGRLFRVDRKSGGVPLLFSAEDKTPKYSGHESVRIPKKFHLIEVITAEAKTFGALYRVEMAK